MIPPIPNDWPLRKVSLLRQPLKKERNETRTETMKASVALLVLLVLALLFAAGAAEGQTTSPEPDPCSIVAQRATEAAKTARLMIRRLRRQLEAAESRIERFETVRRLEENADRQCRALYTSRAKSLNRYMLRNLSGYGQRNYVPEPEYLPADEICELGGGGSDVTIRIR